MEEGLPPGFRFHPSDEELITYYLTRKVTDFEFVSKAIFDVDLNKCEPWDLPVSGKASLGEKVGYFFSLKDRKYPTGMRTNRATNAGYWKTTGKDKEIFHYGVLVGMKKTLVFYKGRAPKGEKTNWVMHEYRLQTDFPYKPSKEEWVVCKIFKKSNDSHMKKPSSSFPSMLLESPGNTLSDQFGDMDESIVNNLPDSSDNFNPILQINDGTADANLNDSRMNDLNKLNLKLYMNLLYGRWQPSESANVGSSTSAFVGSGDAFVRTQELKFADLVQQQQQQQESIWRGY